MNTIVHIEQTQGQNQATGKRWTRYDATLDDGRRASGFTFAKVGDTVEVVQKGEFLNFKPVNGGTSPAQSTPPTQTQLPMRDDRSNRIERQHSQEMALRYATLKKLDALDTEGLRALIDWFQRDIGHVPTKPTAKSEPEAEPTSEDLESEEPF